MLLAVEDKRLQRAVMVGCASFPCRNVVEASHVIRERYPEMTDGQLMICASHTHSGPAVRDFKGWGCADTPYVRTLPQRIAQAAIKALDVMEPVCYQVVRVPCTGIGINRMHESRIPEPEEVLQDGWQPEHRNPPVQATVRFFS